LLIFYPQKKYFRKKFFFFFLVAQGSTSKRALKHRRPEKSETPIKIDANSCYTPYYAISSQPRRYFVAGSVHLKRPKYKKKFLFVQLPTLNFIA